MVALGAFLLHRTGRSQGISVSLEGTQFPETKLLGVIVPDRLQGLPSEKYWGCRSPWARGRPRRTKAGLSAAWLCPASPRPRALFVNKWD